MINRQITLASRPVGFPSEADFSLREVPVPDLGEGQVLVQTHYLSVDPYMRGRIAVCGQISQYNLEKPEMGPRLLWQAIVRRLRIQGFLVFDFQERFDEALAELAGWLAEGRITYREDIVEGIQNAPAAFIGMLKGDNIGKRLVRTV